MKKMLKPALCFITAAMLLLTSACANRNAPSSQASSSQAQEDTPSQSDDQEMPSSSFEAQSEEELYRGILLTYGGVMLSDENGAEYLSSTKMGLFFADDWSKPDELSPEGYYTWRTTMLWKSNLSDEERIERYTHPTKEVGWFFPQEDFESLVRQYFDVSAGHLRSDSGVYHEEDKAYYIGGGGGIGDTPKIMLNSADKDGDMLSLHISLDYRYETDTNKTLTVKLLPDGGYRFESYITE